MIGFPPVYGSVLVFIISSYILSKLKFLKFPNFSLALVKVLPFLSVPTQVIYIFKSHFPLSLFSCVQLKGQTLISFYSIYVKLPPTNCKDSPPLQASLKSSLSIHLILPSSNLIIKDTTPYTLVLPFVILK